MNQKKTISVVHVQLVISEKVKKYTYTLYFNQFTSFVYKMNSKVCGENKQTSRKFNLISKVK